MDFDVQWQLVLANQDESILFLIIIELWHSVLCWAGLLTGQFTKYIPFFNVWGWLSFVSIDSTSSPSRGDKGNKKPQRLSNRKTKNRYRTIITTFKYLDFFSCRDYKENSLLLNFVLLTVSKYNWQWKRWTCQRDKNPTKEQETGQTVLVLH